MSYWEYEDWFCGRWEWSLPHIFSWSKTAGWVWYPSCENLNVLVSVVFITGQADQEKNMKGRLRNPFCAIVLIWIWIPQAKKKKKPALKESKHALEFPTKELRTLTQFLSWNSISVCRSHCRSPLCPYTVLLCWKVQWATPGRESEKVLLHKICRWLDARQDSCFTHHKTW